MREYVKTNNFNNIDFIYNNSYIYENRIISGTRGWDKGDSSEDKKIIKREKLRLELSLADGVKNFGEDKEIIVCMHYPPFNEYEENEFNFINTMKKYNVKKCIYGHLHGEGSKEAKQGEIKGIEFKLASSDYIDFKPLEV
jgi:predicted phosphohydrolase